MSKSCSDYCHALCNPFEAAPCGVPLSPIVSTQKTKVYAKGTAYTGSSGIGSITARPGHAIANDSTCVYYTDSAYAGSTISTTIAAGTLGASTNSPFASANFGPGFDQVSARIVAFGLRFRYSGTELNRGGSKVCLVDPTHNAIGGKSEAEMLADPQAKKLPVTRQWTSLIMQPILSTEYEFRDSTFGNGYMGVLLISPDTSVNMPFEFEAYGIFEFQGSIARAQTHTLADPTGFAAVQSVASQMNSVVNKSTASAAQEMHKAVHQYIGDGISTVTAGVNTAKAISTGASSAWTIFEDIFELAAPVLAWL